MKRYLIFAGYNCFPTGGWTNFIVDSDSLEEAKDYIIRSCAFYDWVHIVDTKHQEIVFVK